MVVLMQEAEVKEDSSATSVSKSGKRQVKPVDLDPHGEKLLQVLSYISVGVVGYVFIIVILGFSNRLFMLGLTILLCEDFSLYSIDFLVHLS